MSNINVIGVIGALFIATFAVTVHVVHLLNRKNIEIVSGVAYGAPVCASPEDFGQEGTFIKRRFMVLA